MAYSINNMSLYCQYKKTTMHHDKINLPKRLGSFKQLNKPVFAPIITPTITPTITPLCKLM